MSDQPPIKRYRRDEKVESSSEDEWKAESDGESENRKKPDFVPYVPVRERRKQQVNIDLNYQLKNVI